MSRVSRSVAQLLADVRANGIDLDAHGNTIRFRPKQAMTPGLLQRLQEHKVELLAMALIHKTRARGDQDLAEAMEEAWGERIAICIEDGKVSQETAGVIALAQLRMMIGQARGDGPLRPNGAAEGGSNGQPAGNAGTAGKLFGEHQEETGPYGRKERRP